MLDNFDFTLLDNQDFKEDSVREDIICPLLKYLGYSTSGPNKIIRSKSLDHPFVHIGTKKHNIKIIPDYLLETTDGQKWILDAKGPKEKILRGKNVEQAFSYAIHPQIRASIYALCNGRELAVFHISKQTPLLVVQTNEFNTRKKEIFNSLSPLAFLNPKKLKFLPDFGLYMTKLGHSSAVPQYFYSIGVPSIVKIDENLYSIFLNIKSDDDWYAISFDFDKKKYNQLLKILPREISTTIKKSLSSQPFKVDITENIPLVNIKAYLNNFVISNEDEDYCPFIVESFKRP